MARIDAYIQQLFSRAGLELVFETGQGAYVRTPSGAVPVLKQALLAPQIVGAFEEIVPDDAKATYPAEGVTTFPYASPSGHVTVSLEKRGGLVRALVTPGDAAAASAVEQQQRASWAWGPAPQVETRPPARTIVERKGFLRGEPREAMEELLVHMVDRRASDLHLNSGTAPMLRVDGDIVTELDYGVLEAKRLEALLFSLAPARNRTQFEETKDTDFAAENERARYRVNLFQDRNGIGAVIRQIPNRILTVEELGLPKAVIDLCGLRKGLVLVTGPTGSGKSTTLAAMIDHINRTREDHIITVEDPIEFVHHNQKCVLNQREVGVHTESFRTALRAALREDPDVVLVGELRDLETMAIALETAETGHLVFGTLHTTTAHSTIDRVIDQFPADRQQQIRLMLSESLKGVVAQNLCRKIGGGRVAAHEVLLSSSAVSNLIREAKIFQIPSIMQTSRAQGMQTLNDGLFELVKKRVVEPAEALARAAQKSELKALLERSGFQVTPCAAT